MLVLSRKAGEKILIGGDTIRLGIEAPRKVPINRSEVQAQIEARKKLPTSEGPEA